MWVQATPTGVQPTSFKAVSMGAMSFQLPGSSRRQRVSSSWYTPTSWGPSSTQVLPFTFVSFKGYPSCKAIIRAAMSAGETPEMRAACPRLLGRMAVSFCRASSRRPARAS